MQKAQDKGEFNLTIPGHAEWMDYFKGKVTGIKPKYAHLYGGNEVPMVDYLKKNAELNAESFEREVVNHLLGQGYFLEELEVEFVNETEKNWGRGIWYKDHPAYVKPIDLIYNGTAINDPKLYHAMFKTEHAGDQTFCLYSMQMMMSSRVLLHKTIIYRKVVLSPPVEAETKAA